MDTWRPATKEEVQDSLKWEQRLTDAEVWERWADKLVEPYAVTIFRFGKVEGAFVVARLPERVVYFDDIEEEFCTATEVDGRLVDDCAYGNGGLIEAIEKASLGQ